MSTPRYHALVKLQTLTNSLISFDRQLIARTLEANTSYKAMFCFAVSPLLGVEKVVGLTGLVIIHAFIASFSPAQGKHNQMVNTKFTRPVNAMPMSNVYSLAFSLPPLRDAGRIRSTFECRPRATAGRW